MRRRFHVRAAILLLALLIASCGGVRGAWSCCTDADCDAPCCEKDAHQPTVIPILPCCRVVTLNHTASQPAPTTVENEPAQIGVPARMVAPLIAVAPSIAAATNPADRLPAPPFYHRHCALLL
jgi:hypothetical protein